MHRICLALLTVASLCVAVPMQGIAASGTGVPAAKQETARDVARAKAKHTLALELIAWSKGAVSAERYNRDLAIFTAQWGSATFASHQNIAATGASISASKNLNVTEYAEQSPSTYCAAGTTC